MTIAARAGAGPGAAAPPVRPGQGFIATGALRAIAERALAYLQAGFPVHFRGPAGTGKTTLATHVAALLGRPVMLIVGDDQLSASDLIGGQRGYSLRRVVDRYVHSVVRFEEDVTQRWVDSRLTTACREGCTLVYDEFTRARPEANNVLLAALEERLLVLPTPARGEAYIKVHPEFRAIFTSNPQEYAGAHGAQDALSDRLITLDLDFYDRETEAAIVAVAAGAHPSTALCVVDLVRALRDTGAQGQAPSMRAALMIARVATERAIAPTAANPHFVELCLDVLESKLSGDSRDRAQRARRRELLLGLIRRHCA